MSENKTRLFLLDAYALILPLVFCIHQKPAVQLEGLNTSAMFGFVNTLDQLLRNEKPSHIAVVFDLNVPTFRHEMFDAIQSQPRGNAPKTSGRLFHISAKLLKPTIFRFLKKPVSKPTM